MVQNTNKWLGTLTPKRTAFVDAIGKHHIQHWKTNEDHFPGCLFHKSQRHRTETGMW